MPHLDAQPTPNSSIKRPNPRPNLALIHRVPSNSGDPPSSLPKRPTHITRRRSLTDTIKRRADPLLADHGPHSLDPIRLPVIHHPIRPELVQERMVLPFRHAKKAERLSLRCACQPSQLQDVKAEGGRGAVDEESGIGVCRGEADDLVEVHTSGKRCGNTEADEQALRAPVCMGQPSPKPAKQEGARPTCAAVMQQRGTVAACSKDTVSGMRKAKSAGVTTNSAKAPGLSLTEQAAGRHGISSSNGKELRHRDHLLVLKQPHDLPPSNLEHPSLCSRGANHQLGARLGPSTQLTNTTATTTPAKSHPMTR